ncbi:hypothetical protein CI610_02087 [invertebrate metagenome]|uniref:Uncharacterized protein n=1 Tax=invertebrate metagenome TaxID=1711999 RepID=A0A2H9T6X9_9ZZZZ
MGENGFARRFSFILGLWLSTLLGFSKIVVSSDVLNLNVFEPDIFETVQQKLRVDRLRGEVRLWLLDRTDSMMVSDFEQTLALLRNWIDGLGSSSEVLPETVFSLKQQWASIEQSVDLEKWQNLILVPNNPYFNQWLLDIEMFYHQLVVLQISHSNDKKTGGMTPHTDIRSMILQGALDISRWVDDKLCHAMVFCEKSVQVDTELSGSITEINQLFFTLYAHPDLNPHARHAIRTSKRIWYFLSKGVLSENKRIVHSAVLFYRNKLIDRLNAAYRLM